MGGGEGAVTVRPTELEPTRDDRQSKGETSLGPYQHHRIPCRRLLDASTAVLGPALLILLFSLPLISILHNGNISADPRLQRRLQSPAALRPAAWVSGPAQRVPARRRHQGRAVRAARL